MNQMPEPESSAEPPDDAPGTRGRSLSPASGSDAERLRSLARRIDPLDAGAHNDLGVVFFQKGLVAEAVAAFRRAMELDPDLDVARENQRLAAAYLQGDEAGPVPAGSPPAPTRARPATGRRGGDDPEASAAGAHLSLDRYLAPAATEEAGREGSGAGTEVGSEARDPNGAGAAAAGWSERGVALHRSGRLQEAVEAYRRAVALDHGHVSAWNNLGVALAQEGRAAPAERALRQAATSDAPPEALWNLGLFLTLSARADEAIAVFRDAIDRDESRAESWSRLGGALFQQGEAGAARGALLRALSLDPELVEARYQLGFTLSALGDSAGALRETRRALELEPVFPAPRYRLLSASGAGEPPVPEPSAGVPSSARGGLATFRFHRADLDRAFSVFTIPDTFEDTATVDPWAAIGAARTALRRGQLGRAADLAARAVAQAPRSADALLTQAEIFLRRGFAGEALERFDAVMALGRTRAQAEARLGRARALLDLGRAREAAAAAEAVAEPGAVEAVTVLGRARLAAGDADGAVAAFEALRTDPDASALLGHAEALMATHRTAEAEARFREVLALDPAAVAARVGLARVLIERGDADGAQEQYGRALETLPSYADAGLGLADLQWHLGRRGGALRTLVRLLSFDPTHVPGLIRLGDWLRQLGREKQGVAALRRALSFDPDNRAALEALRHVPGKES